MNVRRPPTAHERAVFLEGFDQGMREGAHQAGAGVLIATVIAGVSGFALGITCCVILGVL